MLKKKSESKIKAATKEADDIIKDLRQLREQKGADVKEHELIDKKKRLDDHYEAEIYKAKCTKAKIR